MKALITIIACALLSGCASTSNRVIDLTSKPANKTVTEVKKGDTTTTTTTFDFTR